VGDGRLRVIAGEVVARPEVIDPERFQADCVKAFMASWTARGFSSSTIDNDVGVLARMLDALGRPAWEVTTDDVDRVVGALACAGRAVSTRRNYVQVFKGCCCKLKGVRRSLGVGRAGATRAVGSVQV
jgi:hypothetical protein